MCEFCELWDWGEANASVENGKYAHISFAGGSFRFAPKDQFNFCPICGRPNPNKQTSTSPNIHPDAPIMAIRPCGGGWSYCDGRCTACQFYQKRRKTSHFSHNV